MPKTPPPRRHDLDALRAFAMLLGIALHAALSFMPIPWVVQDRSQHAVFGLFVQAVHGFRMPVFFMMSGFFTALLWKRRGLGGLIAQRARRIVLPLVLGCVTIIPLMWVVVIWAGSGSTTYAPASTTRDIWIATAYGELEAVQRFVEDGHDIDRRDPVAGQTPLAWAALTGRSDALELLLSLGADPNARSRDENTPLHSAAFFGRTGCVKRLLDAGADVHARNVHGESPLDVLRHDRRTTEWIAGLLKLPVDFERVAAGRKEIAAMLTARGARAGISSTGAPSGAEEAKGTGEDAGRVLKAIVTGLMTFPFFHHLWFLWFLCWMVAGFAALLGLVRLLRIPRLPDWCVAGPAVWLWIVPATLLPQLAMHSGGATPGFGPDTSAGLLPMPHVLLYYAVFFGFGALYYGARDDEGRLGRAWWLLLPVALVVILPLGMAATWRASWTAGILGDGTARHVVSAVLQVLYAWMMTFGLLGLFRRLLSADRPRIRFVSDSSYWLYLAHLPLVIFGQALLRDWDVPAIVKFTLLLATATAFLLLTYRYIVRYTWLGRLLNGPRSRPGAPSA